MQAYSASLRGKFASKTLPPPYGVTFYSVHTRGGLFFRQRTYPPPYLHSDDNLFSVSKPNRTLSAHLWHSISRQQFYPPPRWRPIFISAQGSSYTIKTVGGEAVRRFFSLKYAVLLYTLSTLFRELSLRQQKSFRKVFAELFSKSDRVPRVPCVPRVNASPRPPHPPRPRCPRR